ncbi:MAG: glycosyltransferase [Candidatus Pacebacteria bacterium CG10_big_fil_rev_8_21_14_0_10_36_11]|nr:MAG: glycosyltransferase [Candidatus Pacebacteria bacterium CG10_big_fil_rev_8_21_14_0_10_36_11]PJC42627.1 MAG: glycosyltransferase [Candidatus Pacebacteria bacterium CG_4_9_14_0_2_um_filter_36_8]
MSFRTLFSFKKFKMSQQKPKKTDETVLLLGRSLFSNDIDSLLNTIKQKIIRPKETLVVYTPNPEQIVLAQKDNKFSQVLNKGDILIPDGVGVVLASKILSLWHNKPAVKTRIAGVDLVKKLLGLAGENNWKVLLLGGKGYDKGLHHVWNSGIAKETKLSLIWESGYEDISQPSKEEESDIQSLIKKTKPDVVFVAFGAPWQELWLDEHRELLSNSGVKLGMAVGGSFDMLFGKIKRAPLFMRAMGLEWLYRLIQEPWRWRRQLQLFVFMGLVLREIIKPKTK